MNKHFRAPIFDTFRKKNPFEGLWEHAAKVGECTKALEETLAAFTAGDHARVRTLAERVSALEFEADQIKSNVRNHLPRNVRMPVEKTLFLDCLGEQDHILDEAEDAAIWMSIRETALDPETAALFERLLAKVVETVHAYGAAVANLHDLIGTGFVKREREEEKELIHRVHQLEHESDVIGRDLSARLLAPETEERLGPVAVYHLLKLSLQLSKVADHAENAGDRLRAMLSR